MSSANTERDLQSDCLRSTCPASAPAFSIRWRPVCFRPLTGPTISPRLVLCLCFLLRCPSIVGNRLLSFYTTRSCFAQRSSQEPPLPPTSAATSTCRERAGDLLASVEAWRLGSMAVGLMPETATEVRFCPQLFLFVPLGLFFFLNKNFPFV